VRARIHPTLRELVGPIDDLTPYDRNPRRGNLDAVMESLQVNGQYRPIVVNRRTGSILAGNHTWLAAKQLGWRRIARTYVDVDDEQAARIVLADNRTADLGTYDDKLLAELLGGLPSIEGTGYDDTALAALLGEPPPKDPDELPEVQPEPVAKLGDLWALGQHRVMCGDTADPAVIDTLLDGQWPRLLFCDPPYGMALDTRYSGMHKANRFGRGGSDYAPVVGDDQPYDPRPLLDRFVHVPEQVWWGADYYRQHLPDGGSWIVWDKRYNEQGMALDDLLGSHFELAWSRAPHKREILRILWAGHHGMQGEDSRRRLHPTQKPVALARHFIERGRGAVLDPYLGSGSTLIAAEQLGVACYGVEIEPAYVDLVAARWQQLTGGQAKRLHPA
jgi:hypothetical protein